jgi:hypothetical protein
VVHHHPTEAPLQLFALEARPSTRCACTIPPIPTSQKQNLLCAVGKTAQDSRASVFALALSRNSKLAPHFHHSLNSLVPENELKERQLIIVRDLKKIPAVPVIGSLK